MKTIKQLAIEARGFIETRKRANGEEFVSYRADAPDWVAGMISAAHGMFLPDDYKYRFIAEALETLSDIAEDKDACDVCLEPDVYTAELTKWLASNVDRLSYVDMGSIYLAANTTCFDRLRAGQVEEMRETFEAVLWALEAQQKKEDRP